MIGQFSTNIYLQRIIFEHTIKNVAFWLIYNFNQASKQNMEECFLENSASINFKQGKLAQASCACQ